MNKGTREQGNERAVRGPKMEEQEGTCCRTRGEWIYPGKVAMRNLDLELCPCRSGCPIYCHPWLVSPLFLDEKLVHRVGC